MALRLTYLSMVILIGHTESPVSDLPLLLATAVTAFIGGVWLTAVVTMATLSHLQRHMQEQVRRWQGRAIRAEKAREKHEW